MAAKQVWKGSVLLAPVPPALVSCGTAEKPNLLTVAWTGIVNTQPPMTYISIRKERYSYRLIEQSGCFAINLTTRALIRAADFCGVKSGRDTDKFAVCKLHAAAASAIEAPILEESPLSLECRVVQKIELGTHDMFLAEIVAVDVEDTLIDKQGRLHLSSANLAAYSHGEYFALGEKLGSFGFSVRKTNKKGKKPRKPLQK